MNNNLIFVKHHLSLFKSFDEVYLFGSSLNNTLSNDIDLLLVYSADNKDSIVKEIDIIISVLFDHFQKPIDITALSHDELSDCGFLEKIKTYIRIK